jgi:hypothetical protein
MRGGEQGIFEIEIGLGEICRAQVLTCRDDAPQARMIDRDRVHPTATKRVLKQTRSI